jgi:predicted hydrocarbon binding protein
MRSAPAWLRGRMLVRLARRLVRNSYQGSRAIARVRGGTARIDLRASIFCSVREPVDHPLCGYYAAAFTRLLTLFNLKSRAEVLACRGTGKAACVVSFALSNVRPHDIEAAA